MRIRIVKLLKEIGASEGRCDRSGRDFGFTLTYLRARISLQYLFLVGGPTAKGMPKDEIEEQAFPVVAAMACFQMPAVESEPAD